MSGKHPNAMRAADERAHPLVQDAIDKGHLESGANYIVHGLPDHATAWQARLPVTRALAHFNLGKACWVVDADGQPCNPKKAPCADENAPHGVAFALYPKDKSRAYIAAQAAGDPSKLKYNPFQPRKKAGLDDQGLPR